MRIDGGKVGLTAPAIGTWQAAELIGPREPYAWRQWQAVREASVPGECSIMARAFDADGNQQPLNADWNVLGYGNNGIAEHTARVTIR